MGSALPMSLLSISMMKMKKIKGNFKLSRVQGNREIVSWFNVWGRAYNAYRLASVQGYDYVQIMRARDGFVLYADGTKPDWLQ